MSKFFLATLLLICIDCFYGCPFLKKGGASNSAQEIPCDEVHQSFQTSIEADSVHKINGPDIQNCLALNSTSCGASAPCCGGLWCSVFRGFTQCTNHYSTYRPTQAPIISRRPTQPSISPTIKPTTTSNPTTTNKPNVLHQTYYPVQSDHAFSFPVCALNGGQAVPYDNSNTTSICSALQSIRLDFAALYKTLLQNEFSLADFLGKALRLAFHDAADIDIRTADLMGADGCLSDAVANAGLIEPNSPVFTLMEPIYQKYCNKINRADFIVYFAKLAVEISEPTFTIHLPYQYGRRETRDCSGGIGRLPDAQDGMDAITQVFIKQMNLTYPDAVALSGGHTLGHVHSSASGYNGHPGYRGFPDVTMNAWDATPTNFDNGYFQTVIQLPWANIYNSLNELDKNIWISSQCGAIPTNNGGPNIYPNSVDVNACQNLAIALNTDMAMYFPVNTTALNPLGYNTGYYLQQCQDATSTVPVNCVGPLNGNNFTYVFYKDAPNPRNPTKTVSGWSDPTGHLDIVFNQMKPLMKMYAANNKAFLNAFAISWVKMVTAGYGTVDGAGGKLGSLFSLYC